MSERGTQSFVLILAECWRKPALLARELAWRWLFGVPALAIVAYECLRIYRAADTALIGAGLNQFTLTDPDQAAVIVGTAVNILRPLVGHILLWLLPLLAIGWSLASGVGRNLVLHRFDPTLAWRPLAVSLLQALRIAALCGACALWYASLHWSAAQALSGAGGSNLVTYFALVIGFSLGLFSLWSLLSWIFYIAPLLLLLENRSLAATLARSLRLGPMTGKLIEVNLVMGIVKLALVVLAMVFSAVPVPFEAQMHGPALYLWWAAVSVLYCVAADFFQLARVIAFVRFWQTAHRHAVSASGTLSA
jgi:hypothetical protein